MNYLEAARAAGHKILTCEFFYHPDGHPLYPDLCCAKCHDPNAVDSGINVHGIIDSGPEKGMIDWFLGIEAIVCCKMYDHVRALPYSWWQDQATIFQTRRIDMRHTSETPKVATEHAYAPRSSPKKRSGEAMRQALERATRKEEEGGIDSFLRR